MKLKKQIEEMKNFMSAAIDNFFNGQEEDKEDIVDDFYNSYFTFSFCDKHTKQTKTVKIFMCPETWEMAESLLNNLEEVLEDYED